MAMTVAPSAEILITVARPIPEAAPVTRQTRLTNRRAEGEPPLGDGTPGGIHSVGPVIEAWPRDQWEAIRR
jgi:hypothetical protein